MKAEVRTPCVFCGRSMAIQSSPYWIVDLENFTVKGLAHTTCAQKAPISYLEKIDTKWGAEPPSKEELMFGCKIAKTIRDKLPIGKVESHSDEFYCRMLLDACLWKTKNPGECFELPRVKELLDWWVNGSRIVSKTQAENIKGLMKELLEA